MITYFSDIFLKSKGYLGLSRNNHLKLLFLSAFCLPFVLYPFFAFISCGEQLCNLKNCSNFNPNKIEFKLSSGQLKSGQYQFLVQHENCSTSCQFSISGFRSDHSPPSCQPKLDSSIEDKSPCKPYSFGVSQWGSNFFVMYLDVSSESDFVDISLSYLGTLFFQTSNKHLKLVDYRPNGPGCIPNCRIGDTETILFNY